MPEVAVRLKQGWPAEELEAVVPGRRLECRDHSARLEDPCPWQAPERIQGPPGKEVLEFALEEDFVAEELEHCERNVRKVRHPLLQGHGRQLDVMPRCA